METYRMPTVVIMGRDCVIKSGGIFKKTGRKAAVVTGKTSGRLSGALDDVIRAMKDNDIGYMVIDNVDNNPGLDNVRETADIARKAGVDHIVGIGGGSALDSAKTAAVLCTNDITPIELYDGNIVNDPLPILAVPTTAGTGSEVTPYAILTVKEKGTKASYGDDRIFPKYAFLDYKYTGSMDRDVTVDTAADSFSHAFEGYISNRTTRMSRLFALESMKIFIDSFAALRDFSMTEKVREDLLYASMLSGTVISQTGTTALHAMGYALTYNMGIPHGRANGLLFSAYIDELDKENKEMLRELSVKLNIGDISVLSDVFRVLFPERIMIESDKIRKFAEDTLKQKSMKYTPAKLDSERIAGIFRSIVK
jgi:alcohol dehydrogenase class IV